MIKLTQTTLDRLQDILVLAGYTIRQEKGNFKSGSCLIESGKLIVLNKFAPVEARVTFLIDAIQKLQISDSHLDDRQKQLLEEVKAYSPEEVKGQSSH